MDTQSVSNVSTNSDRPKTKADWLAILPQTKSKIGPCPGCSVEHTYRRKFPWGDLYWPSTLLKACPKYISMNPVQRGKKIEEIKG